MAALRKWLENTLLDGQYARPTGIVGHVLGARMVRQHAPETAWTLALLDLQPDDKVLEVGSGAGRAIELAAVQLTRGHISGLDISPTMIQSASRRNAQAIRAGRVTLQQGDVMSLPFAENQFAKAFSIQTLYFWPDPLLALAEISRVLRPGATLVVTLSTGTLETSETTGLEYYGQLLEERIIPGMKTSGFSRAWIEQGPPSRQFKTTAILGIK